MRKELFIVGASGHGKVIADIAMKSKCYDRLFFLDDDPEVKECMGIPVVGSSSYSYPETGEVIVAVGNPAVRMRIQSNLEEKGVKIATLIHPDAVLGIDVYIGSGSVIMAGTVINSGTSIGKGAIINTSSSVDHDNQIDDYVHISVGAHLAGTVCVGSMTWIGAGATISNNIQICSGSMIGAGAVVVNNIVVPGTYIGVPARRKGERYENFDFGQ